MNDLFDKSNLDRRSPSADKVKVLFDKFCGAGGRGSCLEGFAIHQLRLGNLDAVRDLIRFLETRIDDHLIEDPEAGAPATIELLRRVREHFEERNEI
jgi:hypothetical protein